VGSDGFDLTGLIAQGIAAIIPGKQPIEEQTEEDEDNE
jgi:hypothetical protein